MQKVISSFLPGCITDHASLWNLAELLYEEGDMEHAYRYIRFSWDETNRYPSRGWNAYHVVYQDAQKWLKEGIHDALFPMMYFQGNNFYPFAFTHFRRFSG